jgi:hypothetical protein
MPGKEARSRSSSLLHPPPDCFPRHGRDRSASRDSAGVLGRRVAARAPNRLFPLPGALTSVVNDGETLTPSRWSVLLAGRVRRDMTRSGSHIMLLEPARCRRGVSSAQPRRLRDSNRAQPPTAAHYVGLLVSVHHGSGFLLVVHHSSVERETVCPERSRTGSRVSVKCAEGLPPVTAGGLSYSLVVADPWVSDSPLTYVACMVISQREGVGKLPPTVAHHLHQG